ncbi:MAG: Gfo/Idh/MocA family oxidoreductase [Planctomycetota bacterium]
MKTIPFGIIGCGLMGREFASAAARWCHLTELDVRPEIVAVANRSENRFGWFTERFDSIKQVTRDYRELLANDRVEAVYAAVPHYLHEEVYTAAIRAGKHLMGEKPFGIDRAANEAILRAAGERPEVFVRCSSQFPFFPAVQRIGQMIDSGALGRVIELSTGFLHSSDLDPNKPINWKRIVELNGRYGVMGDLGMHACHVPFRAGWEPVDVRAVLSNIMTERPDAEGRFAPCETWDNATLLSRMRDPATETEFPWTLKTQRIAPGEKNTWYLEILGTKASVRFSTRNPKRLELLEYGGGEQVWGQVEVGCEGAFATISGAIFEFGFSDAILQMWAAFLYELEHGSPPSRFAGCATLEETAMSHRLFTAALESQETGKTVPVFARDEG